MKNRISILTLCLLLLWSAPALAKEQPDTSGGQTAVTLTYTSGYIIPTDVPYDPDFRFSLTAQTRYTDKTPFSHGFMELHSTVKRAKTDENGAFSMENIEQGSHVFKALDQSNAEVGAMCLRIDRTNSVEETKVISLPDGTTALCVNARIKNLELILELDGQGNMSIVEAHGSQNTTQLHGSQTPVSLNPSTGLLSGPAVPACAVLLLGVLTGAVWSIQKSKNKA